MEKIRQDFKTALDEDVHKILGNNRIKKLKKNTEQFIANDKLLNNNKAATDYCVFEIHNITTNNFIRI